MSTQNSSKTEAKAVAVKLEELGTMSEVNGKIREFKKQLPTDTEPKVTVTGTFPKAKRYNAKEARKQRIEGGITVEKMEVLKVASEWIYCQTKDGEVYLNRTEAKNVVFNIA